LEKAISEAKHSLDTHTLTRQVAQSELTDLVRERTELECMINDIRSAGAQLGGKRSDLQLELALVEEQIAEKEEALQQVLPQWESQKVRESQEKRQLDDTAAKLSALFAKQGRVNRFRTQIERDNYLRHEIASLTAYLASQVAALEATKVELTSGYQLRVGMDEQIARVAGSMENGKSRTRDLAQQLSALKDERSNLVEKRKDLWREDTKLDSQLSHASDQLMAAERGLATMMDKVYFMLGKNYDH
jgi:structural maintenance of chromosome 3 (chondroitin sulfate proteoglycan 6)